jgi:hypothetical protein
MAAGSCAEIGAYPRAALEIFDLREAASHDTHVRGDFDNDDAIRRPFGEPFMEGSVTDGIGVDDALGRKVDPLEIGFQAVTAARTRRPLKSAARRAPWRQKPLLG